jgi:hypothetical protein
MLFHEPGRNGHQRMATRRMGDMKYLVIAEPIRASLPKKRSARSALVEGAQAFVRTRESSGRVEANYAFLAGGGFAIVDAESEQVLMESLHANPMAPHTRYDVRPCVDFESGIQTINRLSQPALED